MLTILSLLGRLIQWNVPWPKDVLYCIHRLTEEGVTAWQLKYVKKWGSKKLHYTFLYRMINITIYCNTTLRLIIWAFFSLDNLGNDFGVDH
jgi:hypothetical protein